MYILEKYFYTKKTNIARFIFLNFLFLFLYSSLVAILIQVFFGQQVNNQAYISETDDLISNHLYSYLFLMLPLSALFEETIYRFPVVYFWKNIKNNKKISLILILQFFFAVFHLGNFNFTIQTFISLFFVQFIAGIILTGIITNIYTKTGSIQKSYLVTSLFHYLHNLLGILMSILLLRIFS